MEKFLVKCVRNVNLPNWPCATIFYGTDRLVLTLSETYRVGTFEVVSSGKTCGKAKGAADHLKRGGSAKTSPLTKRLKFCYEFGTVHGVSDITSPLQFSIQCHRLSQQKDCDHQ
jgi:hypothetical protein